VPVHISITARRCGRLACPSRGELRAGEETLFRPTARSNKSGPRGERAGRCAQEEEEVVRSDFLRRM
jgi:hypothetical protein